MKFCLSHFPQASRAILRHTYQPRPVSSLTQYSKQGPLRFASARLQSSASTPPPPKYPSTSTEPESAVEAIREELEILKHDKWGWVIYRCTYGDDEAWARFQEIVNERSRREMAQSGVPPEVANGLEWTFVSDQSTLDGISRDQLRQRFRAWRTEAMKREQPRATDETIEPDTVRRYRYFVQVDEESLRSVVDGDITRLIDQGWVIFVRCDEHMDFEELTEEDRECIEAEDGDEGWILMASFMLNAEFYHAIGDLPQDWYAFYRLPPDMLVW